MQALGSIEVVGLVAGIEAADVACKTAAVDLVGYELARGGGYVTIKVTGQVAAVSAAMDAAEAAASKLSRVVSTLVIPRPHEQLEPLVYSAATVGHTPPQPEPDPEPAPEPEPTQDPEPQAKPAPKATPKSRGAATTDPAETTPAPRKSTTRRKQS